MLIRRAVNTITLTGDASQWVQLLPAGTFSGRDGDGPYHNEDPQAVIDATLAAASGADLPIDYDHQILWSRNNGQPAVAAGWMRAFESRADGVWAFVEWTPTAASRVRDREYRYLSPVYWHDANGNVIRIEHAALTNVPNLELEAIASRKQTNGGEMDLKQLIAALGLPADTTVDKVLAAVKALAADSAKTRAAHSAMATRLGLPEDATIVTIEQGVAGCLDAIDETAKALGLTAPVKPPQLAACAKDMVRAFQGKEAAAATDPTKYVPMDQHMAVASRLTALETRLATDAATSAVDAAMKAGKVTPKNKDWAVAYASKDPDGFKTYVDGAPVIVAPGQEGPHGQPPKAAGEMGEADLAVCSRLGLTTEEFKKNLQQEGA